MRLNSVTTVASLAIGSGGAAAGFALGTAIFPGVGSIIGAVVGGVAGAYGGEALSGKAYQALEEKIRISKQKRRQKKALMQQTEFHLSPERYDEALALLGLHTSNVTLIEIEDGYLNILEIITMNKQREQQ